MLIWPIVLCFFIVLSIIQHLGGITFSQFLVDPWDKIILDLTLLFIVLGILYRMAFQARKGEKEKLYKKVAELEEKIRKMKGNHETVESQEES